MPEATEGHGQAPASNPDFISQILLLEICINVEGEKRSALCHCSSHSSGSAAIQGIRMLSEGGWADSLPAEQAGNGESHVRQTTDRGLFEEATKQQVMPI